MIVTYDSRNQLVYTGYIKSTNQDFTTDTGLANLLDLGLSVAANERWIIRWLLLATWGTLGLIKVAVTVPAGATLLAMASDSSDGIINAAATTTTSGTGMNVGPALSTGGLISVAATVINGNTAGNVWLQGAQQVSNGTATSFKAGSMVLGHRVN